MTGIDNQLPAPPANAPRPPISDTNVPGPIRHGPGTSALVYQRVRRGRAPIIFGHATHCLPWSAMAEHGEMLFCADTVQASGDERGYCVLQARSEVVLDLGVEATHQPVEGLPAEPGAAVTRPSCAADKRRSRDRGEASAEKNSAGSAQWASWNMVAIASQRSTRRRGRR